MLHAVFQRLADAVFEGLPQVRQHTFPVVGMNLLQGAGGFEFLRRVAEQSLIGGAVVKRLAARIDNGNQVGDVLGDQAETLLAPAQLFGALAHDSLQVVHLRAGLLEQVPFCSLGEHKHSK